jgi:hypothetical protein
MLRALDKWLIPFLRRRAPRSSPNSPVHVLFAICDHFEPLHDSDHAGARRRIAQWQKLYPPLVASLKDSAGRGPRHTFFYPIEQYDPGLLSPLADLCRETAAELEIHLHHHEDTPSGLAAALEQGKRDLASHGFLPTDPSGATRFAFIHGNWALNNSHPLGQGCGVDREIPILRSAGCYADFTMPSAPSPTQSRVVNSIGYLPDLPGRAAIDHLTPAAVSATCPLRHHTDQLLAIQGPLALNFRRRKWGLVPRVENGDLTGANPPTSLRLQLSISLRTSVVGRADWVFVKCHTHGGIEPNFEMLLGAPMRSFHASLASLGAPFRFYYVSAREMANLVHAAEDGHEGTPQEHFDHIYRLPN